MPLNFTRLPRCLMGLHVRNCVHYKMLLKHSQWSQSCKYASNTITTVVMQVGKDCRFKHACSSCGEPHPSSKWPSGGKAVRAGPCSPHGLFPVSSHVDLDPSLYCSTPHLHKLHKKWILYWVSPLICMLDPQVAKQMKLCSTPHLHKCITNKHCTEFHPSSALKLTHRPLPLHVCVCVCIYTGVSALWVDGSWSVLHAARALHQPTARPH